MDRLPPEILIHLLCSTATASSSPPSSFRPCISLPSTNKLFYSLYICHRAELLRTYLKNSRSYTGPNFLALRLLALLPSTSIDNYKLTNRWDAHLPDEETVKTVVELISEWEKLCELQKARNVERRRNLQLSHGGDSDGFSLGQQEEDVRHEKTEILSLNQEGNEERGGILDWEKIDSLDEAEMQTLVRLRKDSSEVFKEYRNYLASTYELAQGA